MPNRFAKIAEESRQKTNDQLAGELASLTILTSDRLDEILPRRSDKARLARLMAIVTSSTRKNEKIAALRGNLNDLGGVLFKVLDAML
jgi:hypothetical protein